MDRLARYQAQLQYTQIEEEQGAEIHRGRQFDGLDVVPSVKESTASMEPNRSGHTAWPLVDRAREIFTATWPIPATLGEGSR